MFRTFLLSLSLSPAFSYLFLECLTKRGVGSSVPLGYVSHTTNNSIVLVLTPVQYIPNVGIYLPEPVFSHGQLYVALSRGVSRQTTRILSKPNKELDTTGKTTKNIVYRDVLNWWWVLSNIFHPVSLPLFPNKWNFLLICRNLLNLYWMK